MKNDAALLLWMWSPGRPSRSQGVEREPTDALTRALRPDARSDRPMALGTAPAEATARPRRARR